MCMSQKTYKAPRRSALVRTGGRIRLPAVLLAAFAAASVALGAATAVCLGNIGHWKDRAASLEAALSASQAAAAQAEAILAQRSAEADALRSAAELSAQLQSEVALSRQEMIAFQGEAERQTSLANAHAERAEALSAENERLHRTLGQMRLQRQEDRAEIERLGGLLTECEETLAGTEVLYKEASLSLSRARSRAAEDKAEIEALYAKLTRVEEEYAGASALLAESGEEIERAQEIALSHFHSAQSALFASEAKQAQIDRLLGKTSGEHPPMPSAPAETSAP